MLNRTFALAVAAAILMTATPVVASAQAADPTPEQPAIGKCVGYYRIMTIITGETKSPANMPRYPWPREVAKVAASPQNWSVRQAAAAAKLHEITPEAAEADAYVARQIKAAELAAQVASLGVLGLPDRANPQVAHVIAETAKCDAALGFAKAQK